MTRSVLLVTPYFAPQTHAAMFRVHKLAKYLPQYGWKPIVLTTDTNYLYNENPALLDELPPEVEIHRARYVEPSLRGVRMALGGEDRTFAALKKQGRLPQHSSGHQDEHVAEPPLLRRAYGQFLKRAAQRPDPYRTWRGPALQMARQLIREKNISVVYTTSPPYTPMQIGLALQKELGCKWVMDLRDPLTTYFRHVSEVDSVFLQQRDIERDAIHRADHIAAASSSFIPLYNDLYGVDITRRASFIPTGLDDGLVTSQERTERGHIVFAGEYLAVYGDSSWRILRKALDMEEGLEDFLKVSVIGHEGINRALVLPQVERYRLQEHVRLVDHLPQQELYRQLAKAHAALLPLGSGFRWWVLPAKMVDYIALQKPVLALVPNPSEARKELSRAGLGVFLDGSVEEAAQTLATFLRGDSSVQVNPRVSKDYLASSQVEAFAQVFDSLLGS